MQKFTRYFWKSGYSKVKAVRKAHKGLHQTWRIMLLHMLPGPRCPANKDFTLFSLNTESHRRKVNWCQASIIFAVNESKVLSGFFLAYHTFDLYCCGRAVKNRAGLCIWHRSKLNLWLIYLFLKRFCLYSLAQSYTSMQMTPFSIFVSALKAPWCVQSADVRSFICWFLHLHVPVLVVKIPQVLVC